MSGWLVALCVGITLAAGCTCVVPNPALCHGPEDCPGAYCDPVLMVCIDVDAPDSGADYIAFVSRRDGNDEIYRMRSDGTEQINLTSDPGSDTDPLWDPTGARIAFLSDRDGSIQLFVMNVDGTGVIRVSGGQATRFTWSPDGTMLAFDSDRSGRQEIYRVGNDGTMLMPLTDGTATGTESRAPVWSPAGGAIAYSSSLVGCMTMDADGSNPSVVETNAFAPRWRPDGTKIAFYRRDFMLASDDVFLINPDGSQLVNLTNTAAREWAPLWSPEGSALLAVRNIDEEIVVISVSSGFQWSVSMSPAADRAPAWSPDGTSVVYTSDRNGNEDVFVVARDGGPSTPLTSDLADDTAPSWRPRP